MYTRMLRMTSLSTESAVLTSASIVPCTLTVSGSAKRLVPFTNSESCFKQSAAASASSVLTASASVFIRSRIFAPASAASPLTSPIKSCSCEAVSAAYASAVSR